MKVLGIDPGLAACGLAIVEEDGHQIAVLMAEVFRTSPKKGRESSAPDEESKRLYDIAQRCDEIILAYAPQEAAAEQLIFAKNKKTAIRVAQARGSLLAVLGRHALPVYSYSPRDIKKSLTGYGAATKAQIQLMVQRRTGLKRRLPKDAADAVAVALCHLHRRRIYARIDSSREDSLLSGVVKKFC